MNEQNLALLQAGDIFEGFVLVKSVAVRSGQTGKNYIDLTVSDHKSRMSGKIWDYDEARYAFLQPNTLVKARGTVVAWQGALQLRVEKIRATKPEDDVKVEDYVKSAPEPGELMYGEVAKHAAAIADGELRALCQAVLEEYKEQLPYWPAAMANHHAIRGGLLYHTLTMLRAGLALCGVYTHLSPDWVRAGVILHDLEKIHELDASPLGTVSDYTRDGLLLGHIAQGIIHLHQTGERLNTNPEKLTLLEHMLLSHHYEPEYGAIRRPMFPEAELLHYLDILDARLYDFAEGLEDVLPGGFSEKKFLLHNRRLYKRNCP